MKRETKNIISLFFIISAIVVLLGTTTRPPIRAQDDSFPPGTVFVSEQGTGNVSAILPDGTKNVVARGLKDPRGVSVSRDGAGIYLVQQSAGKLSSITFGGRRPRMRTVRSGLNTPEGVAIDRNGDILVTEFFADRLVRISPDGRQLEDLGEFDRPTGVGVDLEGNIIVAEFRTGKLFSLPANTNGKQNDRTLIADGLKDPDLIAVAPNGRIYVTEFSAGQITEVDLQTGAKRVIIDGLKEPVGVAVGPASSSFSKAGGTPVGDSVYCTNNPVGGKNPDSDEVLEVDSRTGYFVPWATVTNGAGLAAKLYQRIVRVLVYQLNWLNKDGSVLVPNSKVGAAKFVFNPTATQFLEANGGAFVNVGFDFGQGLQWLVRNLFLMYPNLKHMLDSSPTVHFPLGVENGTRVNEIGCTLSVTEVPLTALPDLPVKKIPVEQRDYGVCDSWKVNITSIGPWVGPSPPAKKPKRSAYTFLAGGDLPEVDEDVNACAPAGAARSIKYMMDRKGIKTDPTQKIYKDLIDHMDTEINEGDGTTPGNILDGKNVYAFDNNLPIDSSLDFDNPACPDNVADVLDDGGDIEVIIGWDPDGGHLAMVTSIHCFDDGTYVLTYVDDPTQGDGRAQNRQHSIYVQPRGHFGGGNVGGFMLESVTK